MGRVELLAHMAKFQFAKLGRYEAAEVAERMQFDAKSEAAAAR